MISFIQKRHSNHSTMNTSESVRVEAGFGRQIAPLASLDCSITEPISGQHSSGNSTETPTLSDYFDCDQLSDMIDDSLFEITHAGCLSRSVFSGRAVPVEERDLILNRIGSKQASKDDDDGSKTPTNNIDAGRGGKLCEEMVGHQHPVLLACRQPYDYSSSSSIPAHTRALASDASRRRFKSSCPSSVASLSKGGAKSSGQTTPLRSQRKARSNPDVRAGEQELACAACLERGAELEKKKERKRFTFSLFSLFTGGSGHLNGNRYQPSLDRSFQGASCCHHRLQNSGSGQKKASSVSTGDTGNRIGQIKAPCRKPISRRLNATDKCYTPIKPIKSRDSIKLTNQRKKRSGLARAPDSTDEPSRTELLLDLSARSETRQHGLLRSSQSSHNIQSGTFGANRSQRPTKSVKFASPDEVLVYPDRGSSSKSSNSYLPPANSPQPSTHNQRRIQKSSSYSQTESSKKLDDLLARYEANEELIFQINEKLNLTEAIASPVSSLDRRPDDSDAISLAQSLSDRCNSSSKSYRGPSSLRINSLSDGLEATEPFKNHSKNELSFNA